MVKCESCGTDLPEGVKFCSNCGAPVGKIVKEEFTVSSEDLVGEIKKILREGNVTRIILRDEKGRVLLEIPAWAGVVGAILTPWLAALGVIGALATRCTISVVRRE
ncbi:MAG: DUF4342 domain-containing protein [Candidatus Bathyarchaeia archaeon]